MADRPLRTTAGELVRLFGSYPADLPVQFEPITAAWLGTMEPMRVSGDPPSIYNAAGESAVASEDGAYLSVFLFEDQP